MFRTFMRVAVGLCAAATAIAAQAASPSWARDVAGAEDHPLIRRYNDSWLVAYQQLGFAGSVFPSKLGLDKQNDYLSPINVEGRITRLVYFAPLGKTALEVHRNYEQALNAAGMKAVVACTPAQPTCEHMRFPLGDRYNGMTEVDFQVERDRNKEGSKLYEQMRSVGGASNLGAQNMHFTYGTLERNGTKVHVIVSTGQIYRSDFVATYLEIAEPQAMKGGQVTVNADGLQKGLKADGKIALYGIYFDTGKAVVKPESNAQLDEIARMLNAQPKLKVYLVGHTDNQGVPEANVSLSQQRAQAVAEALTKGYKIDAARLIARGVGHLAPVASNEAESGRALNRRVELVLP
ncbi:OmpA family protein [Ideonella sp. DXS29W]|uniref:OmpA family protein n=1 Tax=Ideonella lacteola TaxID=2984193 RepID=A0ABU9BSL2_9BURK